MGACEDAEKFQKDEATDDMAVQTSISLIFLGTVAASPEQIWKVEHIKARCDKMRKEAEANRLAGSEARTLLAEMMGAVNRNDKSDDG